MTLRLVPVRVSRAALALTVIAASCCVAAGCGGDKPTDPGVQLQITCPASKSAESITGETVAVAYGVPTTSGGTAPVSVTCSPADGSKFPVGTTSVTCTAQDAKSVKASCGLNVTVTRVGTLSATRFMAFGDSITFGTPPSACPALSSSLSIQERLRLDTNWLRALVSPRESPPETSYPSVLKGLLAGRYATQTTTVFNEGSPGEFATDGGGTKDETLARLRQRLIADVPDAVLLLEGINDVNELMNHMPDRIPSLIKALRDFIAEARSRRATVLIGTLLPEDPNGCRGRKGYDLVPLANEQIKAMAISEGAVVVDVYQAFGGVGAPPYIIVEDGLHPTPAGYEKMAQTFLEGIRTHLEVPH